MKKEHNDIHERLSALETKTEETGKTVWRIFEAIYGNGKPGIISDLRCLTENVEKHHKNVEQLQARSHNDWKWIISSIIAVSAVIVAFVK